MIIINSSGHDNLPLLPANRLCPTTITNFGPVFQDHKNVTTDFGPASQDHKSISGFSYIPPVNPCLGLT